MLFCNLAGDGEAKPRTLALVFCQAGEALQ